MRLLRNCLFTNYVFILSEDGEIDTNRFFRDSRELTNFIDKKLDKNDNYPCLY